MSYNHVYVCTQHQERTLQAALLTFFTKVIFVSSLGDLMAELRRNEETDRFFLFIDSDLIKIFSESSPQSAYVIAIEASSDTLPAHPIIKDVLYLKQANYLLQQVERIQRNMETLVTRRAHEVEFQHLYEIGQRFGAKRNLDQLFETILEACMEISDAEAASLYSIIDANTGSWSAYDHISDAQVRIKFEVAKNKTIPLNLQSKTLPISQNSIVGYCIKTQHPQRIDDVRERTAGSDYQHDTHIENATGYQAISFLTVPMMDQKGRVLGAVQLINKKSEGSIIPFSSKDEKLISALAGYAAIAFENSYLYLEMQQLMDTYEQLILKRKIPATVQLDNLSKLNDLIEETPNAMLITNAKGYILYTNRRFTEMTGYTASEVIGKKPSLLKSGKTEPEVYQDFWETLSDGKDWTGEFLNRKKNGYLYWEKKSVSSIKDSQGSIKYYVSISDDISMLKEMNTKLNHTLDRLQRSQMLLSSSHVTDSLTTVQNTLESLKNQMTSIFEIYDWMEARIYELPLSIKAKYEESKIEADIKTIRQKISRDLDASIAETSHAAATIKASQDAI